MAQLAPQHDECHIHFACANSVATAMLPVAAMQLVVIIYTVFQKKTSTHIIGYKLRNSCPILIIFDMKIPHII